MPHQQRRKKDALLEAIADSAVELLRFHDIEKFLPTILSSLGAATKVDRMQLLQYEETPTGEYRIVQHFGWCAPGVEPSILEGWAEGKTMEDTGFRPWGDKLSRGEIITGRPDSFEPAIRKFLEDDGVCSVVVVPIFVEDCWWGLIGFDDCHSVREWTSRETGALRTIAELVGTAVQRARDIDKLANAKRIVEESPTVLFRVEPRPPYALSYISPNIERYGYSSGELLAEPTRWTELIEPSDLPDMMSSLQSLTDGEISEAHAEFRLIRPDGTPVWFDGHSRGFHDGGSELIAIEGVITDITERKRAAQEIERMAQTDPLTGLVNRGAFLEKLAEACTSAGTRSAPFALHFIDLDYFKPVNDTFGHPAGDALLKAVAGRLRRSVRESDIVARFGGDEFAVLQTDLPSARFAESVADKICKAISEPYMITGNKIEVSASIGVNCHHDGAARPDEILARADLALYRAKEDGRNRVCIYTHALEASEGTAMASNLRTAPAA